METFATADRINVDPKGFHRQVDRFERTPFGLYMARGADHPKFGYLESWLLPELKLRANVFHFREGVAQDFYIDVAEINHSQHTWTTRDLYVDLVSTNRRPIEVLDIDELAAATSAGLIDAADAETAIEATLRAVEGITRHNDDPMAWFASLGMNLFWADSVELTPAG